MVALDRTSRRRRARPLVAVAALVTSGALCMGTLAGAQAATQAKPPVSTLPKPKGGNDSAVLVKGVNTVVKAKTRVTLAPFELRAYANEKFSVKKGVLTSGTRAWVLTRVGRHPTYGVFPVTHVAVLGFGAVPITADLTLSQPYVNGALTPLIIDSRVDVTAQGRTFPTTVTGPVNLRLSDVLVDRVPLRVGANCHTQTPVQLHLTGHAPKYSLFTGGPLRGKITIPPFANCGIGGNNLNPLLTGTISGPGNPLVQYQGNLGAWDPNRPRDCDGCLPPKTPR